MSSVSLSRPLQTYTILDPSAIARAASCALERFLGKPSNLCEQSQNRNIKHILKAKHFSNLSNFPKKGKVLVEKEKKENRTNHRKKEKKSVIKLANAS